MYLKTQGLVLRVTDYNDKDALLTLLTPNHGKLTVKARGLRRKNSPLIAPCQLLAYGEFVLFDYKGNLTVNEAVSIELFQNLRKDLCALSLGSYFAQAAELICQEDSPNPELLSLVLNCLYGLSKLDIPREKVKAVFELRIACLAGYMPEMGGCLVCGRENPDRFDLSAGSLVCSRCGGIQNAGIRMPVNDAVVQAMRYIVNCEPKRLFAFALGAENLTLLAQITEGYLCTQLERGSSALDFYKSLLI
ncbi:MAG: DNA repair protein RecO [Ruminococcaceae bacterium]|nr:DNA repair protein RecO [Oscillospiraceae bacterium]